jgi:peptide/nickel transport system permease protein
MRAGQTSSIGSLLGFLIRRVVLAAVVFAVTSCLAWLVFASALNPLSVFFPDFKSKDALAAVARGHLHEPTLARYWIWVKGMFSGAGFGHTIAYDRPVWPLVEPAFLRTLQLMAFALVIVVALSVLVGMTSARRRRSAVDVSLRGFAYVAWSIPAFLLALLLQRLVAGVQDTWHVQPFAYNGPPTHGVQDWFQHMVLPAVAVALGLAGAYSRYLRSSLLVVLDASYITVARAKGLSERRIVRRHALRNAFIPFTTMIAFDFGALFGASLAADYVFRLGGMASLFLNQGLFEADPNIIEAELILTALLVIGAGILADVAAGWLDPRVRLT